MKFTSKLDSPTDRSECVALSLFHPTFGSGSSSSLSLLSLPFSLRVTCFVARYRSCHLLSLVAAHMLSFVSFVTACVTCVACFRWLRAIRSRSCCMWLRQFYPVTCFEAAHQVRFCCSRCLGHHVCLILFTWLHLMKVIVQVHPFVLPMFLSAVPGGPSR